MKNFDICIVTLSKNNPSELRLTADSIFKQDYDGHIYWFVFDGSMHSAVLTEYNKIVSSEFYFRVNITTSYVSTSNSGVYGIYPSFNYSKQFIKGDAVMYLNSGDTLFDSISLKTLAGCLSASNSTFSCAFGQAKVYASSGLNWLFPSSIVYNIRSWLNTFEPNHQSMLVSTRLALGISYDDSLPLSADKLWKRNVINLASSVIYTPHAVCAFKLGGVSSIRKPFHLLYKEMLHPELSFGTKICSLAKALLPDFLFPCYYYLMRAKALICDIRFSKYFI